MAGVGRNMPASRLGDCLPCSARPAHAGCDRELMSLTALSARNRLPAFPAFSTSPPASGAISRRSMSGSRRAVAWRSAMALPAPGRSRAVPCRPMPTRPSRANSTKPRTSSQTGAAGSPSTATGIRLRKRRTARRASSQESRASCRGPISQDEQQDSKGGSTAPRVAVWCVTGPRLSRGSRQQQSQPRHRRGQGRGGPNEFSLVRQQVSRPAPQ